MMRISTILPFIILCLASFAYSQDDEKFTYMDHEKEMNKVICAKTSQCDKNTDAGQCLTRLNGVSEAKYFNKTVPVYKSRSSDCIKALQKFSCDNIVEKSIQGHCDRNLLQQKPVKTPSDQSD